MKKVSKCENIKVGHDKYYATKYSRKKMKKTQLCQGMSSLISIYLGELLLSESSDNQLISLQLALKWSIRITFNTNEWPKWLECSDNRFKSLIVSIDILRNRNVYIQSTCDPIDAIFHFPFFECDLWLVTLNSNKNSNFTSTIIPNAELSQLYSIETISFFRALKLMRRFHLDWNIFIRKFGMVYFCNANDSLSDTELFGVFWSKWKLKI